MDQPDGFVVKGKEDKVCLLRRSLYRTQTGSQTVEHQVHGVPVTIWIQSPQLPTQVSLCHKKRIEVMYLLLYVDDGLLVGSDKQKLEDVVSVMKQEFEMTICSSDYFVGMQIDRDRKNKQIIVHQERYAGQVLETIRTGKHASEVCSC